MKTDSNLITLNQKASKMSNLELVEEINRMIIEGFNDDQIISSLEDKSENNSEIKVEENGN